MKWLIIGEIIALAILITLCWRSAGNEDKREAAKRKANDAGNKVSPSLPNLGYGDNGRKNLTELEALAEADTVDIQKIEDQKENQKILDYKRRKGGKKSRTRDRFRYN